MITTYNETDTVGLFLEGADSRYTAPVGSLFLGRDSGFMDEGNGVVS